MTAIELNAATRLLADSKEAGRVLTAVKKVLGPHFVTDEDSDEQRIIWKSSKFSAELDLTMDSDTLLFSLRTKNFAGGFDAEGKTAAKLFEDIRYQVTEFVPEGKVPPDIKALRAKFATIK
jgi:hypothetical protein